MTRMIPLAAVFLALTCAASAGAQDQPGGRVPIGSSEGRGLRPDTWSEFLLLVEPAVRKELKVTDDQMAKLRETGERLSRAKMKLNEQRARKVKELGASPDPQAQRELSQGYTEEYDAVTAKSTEDVRKILDRAQFTRLEQIRMQVEGWAAFERPEVQKQLNLFPEHIEAIHEIIEAAKTEFNRAATVPAEVSVDVTKATRVQVKASRESKAFKDAVKDTRQNLLKIRDETMRQILKVMTRGQRARYQRMLGEPFEFKQLWEGPKPAAPATAQAKQAP